MGSTVLTHLHWDHCLNAHLFPKARFIVQRAEMRYAIAPLPVHYGQYGNPLPGTRPLLPPDSRVEVIDGDWRLVKGVSLALLPGHTLGLQAVRVETNAGTYLIASDNVPFYENWNGEPPHLPHIPSNLHVDLEAYHASLTKMESIADHILPGHDPEVLARSSYP
jgi:N-acyl homoserine lactone hydrolase